jgi:hypothetical protein
MRLRRYGDMACDLKDRYHFSSGEVPTDHLPNVRHAVEACVNLDTVHSWPPYILPNADVRQMKNSKRASGSRYALGCQPIRVIDRNSLQVQARLGMQATLRRCGRCVRQRTTQTNLQWRVRER